ncbi:MAG: GTP cyclohydrolase FolE2 [Verrucomicrobiales bacterium]
MAPPQESLQLPDLQHTEDTRGVAIERVGVCDLRYPITVLDRANQQQQVAAILSLSVDLPHHFKGTHMSRFLEVLENHRGEVTMRTVPAMLDELQERLDAERAHVEVRFPYFIEKAAPVSGKKSFMDYDCGFIAEVNGDGHDFIINVCVPVKSLCPCSKAISDYGAHNQRGIVDIQLRCAPDANGQPHLVWIEELVEVAESSASAPVYALLKREDERHVTMQAFDNPAFVDDIARNVAVRLREEPRVTWFKVRVTNFESIHNHSAFAVVSSESAVR